MYVDLLLIPDRSPKLNCIPPQGGERRFGVGPVTGAAPRQDRRRNGHRPPRRDFGVTAATLVFSLSMTLGMCGPCGLCPQSTTGPQPPAEGRLKRILVANGSTSDLLLEVETTDGDLYRYYGPKDELGLPQALRRLEFGRETVMAGLDFGVDGRVSRMWESAGDAFDVEWLSPSEFVLHPDDGSNPTTVSVPADQVEQISRASARLAAWTTERPAVAAADALRSKQAPFDLGEETRILVRVRGCDGRTPEVGDGVTVSGKIGLRPFGPLQANYNSYLDAYTTVLNRPPSHAELYRDYVCENIYRLMLATCEASGSVVHACELHPVACAIAGLQALLCATVGRAPDPAQDDFVEAACGLIEMQQEFPSEILAEYQFDSLSVSAALRLTGCGGTRMRRAGPVVAGPGASTVELELDGCDEYESGKYSAIMLIPEGAPVAAGRPDLTEAAFQATPQWAKTVAVGDCEVARFGYAGLDIGEHGRHTTLTSHADLKRRPLSESGYCPGAVADSTLLQTANLFRLSEHEELHISASLEGVAMERGSSAKLNIYWMLPIDVEPIELQLGEGPDAVLETERTITFEQLQRLYADTRLNVGGSAGIIPGLEAPNATGNDCLVFGFSTSFVNEARVVSPTGASLSVARVTIVVSVIKLPAGEDIGPPFHGGQ